MTIFLDNFRASQSSSASSESADYTYDNATVDPNWYETTKYQQSRLYQNIKTPNQSRGIGPITTMGRRDLKKLAESILNSTGSGTDRCDTPATDSAINMSQTSSGSDDDQITTERVSSSDTQRTLNSCKQSTLSSQNTQSLNSSNHTLTHCRSFRRTIPHKSEQEDDKSDPVVTSPVLGESVVGDSVQLEIVFPSRNSFYGRRSSIV